MSKTLSKKQYKIIQIIYVVVLFLESIFFIKIESVFEQASDSFRTIAYVFFIFIAFGTIKQIKKIFQPYESFKEEFLKEKYQNDN